MERPPGFAGDGRTVVRLFLFLLLILCARQAMAQATPPPPGGGRTRRSRELANPLIEKAGRETLVPRRSSTPASSFKLETPLMGSVRIGRHFAGNPNFSFDSDAAVGTRHFAEFSNRSFRVYNKYTGSLMSEFNLFTDKMRLGEGFDHRLRFDHASRRWIAIGDYAYNTPVNALTIAASATDDPLGDWQGTNIVTDTTGSLFADYPMLGFDGAGAYITTDLYALNSPYDIVRRDLYSFPKDDLLASDFSIANFTRLTVDNYNAQTDYLGSSTDGLLLQDVGLTPQSSPGQYTEEASTREIIGADGPNASLSAPVPVWVDLSAIDIGALNVQPGTDQTLGDYPGALTCVRVGNLLYRVEPNHDLGGIVWSVRDATTNTAVQGGQIADPDHSYIDPAINANDSGDVVIAYIRSGPTEFASAYASVGHAQSDGSLAFDPPLLLKAGTDIYDTNGPKFVDGTARMSDFSSSVTIDPNDHTRFWVSNAYCSGRNVASTYITELIVDSNVTAPARLANISTRALVLPGDKVLIGGFIVTGSAPKKVILRALGPSLTSQGVSGALADPVLTLHEPDGTIITNDDWKQTQEAEIEATTIPPTDDRESAIVATLNPGTYTAVVTGYTGGTGVGLVEVYDLDQTADSQLANISTRGFVDIDDNVLIGGFIGTGVDAQVLVRAIGPELSSRGVTGALADTTLELHDPDGAVIAFNDNWKDSQWVDIAATGLAPTVDQESAILATMPASNYTAVVRGKNASSGVALIEAYNIPPATGSD